MHQIHTSSYHPQTDRLVERFNQTLTVMLRKVAQTEGKDWDKLIPFLLFAYQKVPQASTGSPNLNSFMGGLSEDLWTSYESWEAPMRVLYCTYCYCKSSWRRCLSWLVPTCSQHRAPRRSSMIRQQESSFQVGDQVLILLPTTTSKLAAEW